MWCPFCGRDAPIVYRGVVPCCTACGRLRLPLSGPSVNLAGKPAAVGGAVARVAGWLTLLVGVSFALGLGLLFYALTTIATALAFSLPVALVALVSGIALLQSGRLLTRSGASAARTTHDQALLELAAHRGPVTAQDAARALGISAMEADTILTDLAKREPDRVVMEFDEEGVIRYRAADTFPGPGVHVRVGPDVVAKDGLRVEVPSREADEAPSPEEDAAARAARLR